jgi:PPK2 family polyphosphate:nucleotide phosphotransferase
MSDERAERIADFIAPLRVKPGSKVDLSIDFDPGFKAGISGKKDGQELLRTGVTLLADYQRRLAAEGRYGVLMCLQSLDAGGKDGTIRHVMSGVNPQGCQVFSFKKPSAEELDHNFLWRYMKSLPERGRIGIFNRSYYEDVLVVKVHPELIGRQLPRRRDNPGRKFWAHRYDDINAFERHLVRNGTIVLKFFLHVSKDEQKKRFLERLDEPEKNWKFSLNDLEERKYWDDYIEAYQEAFAATSTDWAPWYVVPADHKWITRAIVADIITTTLRNLELEYPQMTEEQERLFAEARARLAEE